MLETYVLEVFYPAAASAEEIMRVSRATEVLEQIQGLLAKHPQCERIAVSMNGARLFAVDCAGNRLNE